MSAEWRKRLPAQVRTLHLYASLSASFAIAFFAATGLVGELRSRDEGASEAAAVRAPWQALPAEAPTDRAGLARWFAQRFGGEAETSDDPDDLRAASVQVTLTSVWRTRTITVERAQRRWSERVEQRALSSALADLHTGKHAGWWQRRLMDATAVTLLFSTLTGLCLGLVWVAQRRRRLALIPLIGGCAWLIMLVCAR